MNTRQQKYYDELKEHAKNLGGELLSTIYNNSYTKLKFRCTKGHEFEMSPNSVRSNHWCNNCSRNLDEIKEEFYKLVKEKGGICLSEYKNAHIHVEIECDNNHIFKVTPHALKGMGTWCKYCYGNDNEIGKETYINRITSMEFEMLSEYINSKTYIKLRCNKGHIWESLPYNITAGKGCFECTHGPCQEAKDRFYKLIELKNGKVLSTYINSVTHVELSCDKDHKWKAKPNSIFNGTWCPVCVKSRGEYEIDRLFTKWGANYQREFIHYDFHKVSDSKCRYDFLFFYYNKPYLLEFDGVQHFKQITYFQDNEEKFKQRREYDILKTKFARSCNIPLIRISYKDVDNIQDHIFNAVNLLNYTDDITSNGTGFLYLSNTKMYDWLSSADNPLLIK